MGWGSVAVSPLAAGTYRVRLAATDLAGNFNRVAGTLQLTAAEPHPSGDSGTKPAH
jgi:hypothetical protein